MLKLQCIGNVGQNAKIQEVNGRKSINFSIAHNRSFTNSEGVKVEETTWISCSYWKEKEQSVKIAEYLTAGTKIFVEGIPSVRTYKNKEGQTLAAFNLNVIQVELLAAKKDNNEKQPSTANDPGAEYLKEHAAAYNEMNAPF